MSSRYLIGIDLGTTNSVLAYIDTQESMDQESAIHVMPVPQLAGHGEVCTLPALPSFLYFPTEEELSSGGVTATWEEDPPMATGVLAREQGALVPSRQVSSAKSWLSYSGVDRRSKILPAQAEPPLPMISPVEASSRYLMHLRATWNSAMANEPNARFEQQEVVLTVPASFDEVARELTVEAARNAGFEKFTLLEEPLAAFYAWMAANQECRDILCDGELILICDIGGGTTDFSLIRVRSVEGDFRFERTAIGEHLLLGGDNLDFALAQRVEEKLQGAKLSLRQRYALRRACCSQKERLLSDPSLEKAAITILGSGSAVIGQARSVELTREEVLGTLLHGFLPLSDASELPSRGRPMGLRELGLPYASDPAITKHLAAFLAQAAVAMNGDESSGFVRPDAVLFNGGFCIPDITRERILEVLSHWFEDRERGWRPKLLQNRDVDSAVARGAAHYGRVRRGAAARIQAGSARAYYIALESGTSLQAICVLPAGTEEGTTLPSLQREFSVLANRPVSFALYSSRTRHDRHGEVVTLDPAEVQRHDPLVTLLRYGKKLRDVYLTVGLSVSLTEVGTLELWCESRDTTHRWRLQFELRGEAAETQVPGNERSTPGPSATTAVPDAMVESAIVLLRRVFGDSSESDSSPDSLIREMETALESKREAWPVSTLRRLADVLLEKASGMKKSPRHELRWLNLYGWCMRPGFGAPEDERRVHDLRRVATRELLFSDDLQCQVEMLVMQRRIAGGLHASVQQALYRNYAGILDRKKKSRVNRQLEYEQWRLFASLEHLPANTRAKLGERLFERILHEPKDAIWLWTLGRLGARIPLYGPLHSVVAPRIVAEWMEALLEMPELTTAAVAAIVAMSRYTGDASRDLEGTIREQARSRLQELESAGEMLHLFSDFVAPNREEVVRSFGEPLPSGLDLISSSNCLLSLPAIHRAGPVVSRHA